MPANLWLLYRQMLRSRLFEEAVSQLWHEGLISGEMHLGTGEEAIIAGVLFHLHDGDALALDHRGTAAMLMRGVDPVALLREILGRPDGLCRGWGGHMHLFSKEHLAASSGIVGASGPTATGFALAAKFLRPGTVAVAFFGDGAVNQGMLMEAMNLAAVWHLPVLFVCKDDGWAITTRSTEATAGDLAERARGLGVEPLEADGLEVEDVWEVSGRAVEALRQGGSPCFLHARCVHLEGHFLGFQLIKAIRTPMREVPKMAAPLTKSLLRRGAPVGERFAGLKAVIGALLETIRDPRQQAGNDPVVRVREKLKTDSSRLQALETEVRDEVTGIVSRALQEESV